MRYVKEPLMNKLILIFVIIGLNGFFPFKGLSCPIPVFRYALEYWDTDPYILEIMYKKPLNPREEKLVKSLYNDDPGGEMKVNLEVRKTAVEGNIDHALRNSLKGHTDAELPLMVLRFPRISGINEIIWSGPLNKKNIDFLLHSPAREQIGKKLLKNATAVWIFLESGDKRKDRDALNKLDKELRRLEKTLVLRDPEMWWGDSQDIKNGNVPVIEFDIVQVSRLDPREERLVEMLLNSEEDLKEFEQEPMVFPVYGRGIVLYGIVGKGINEWNIREAAEFVTGDCSCQAKVSNPGVDLLMSLDWDEHVRNLTDINIANPLSGIGDFGNKEEEVRRLLESATLKRMGKEGINAEDLGTDSSKIVYLDIATDNKPGIGDKENDLNRDNNPMIMEAENGENQQGNSYLERSEEEIQETPANAFQKKSDLSHVVMMALAGIVFLVLLGGIIIYRKASKQ
jgi:hypothetical protein